MERKNKWMMFGNYLAALADFFFFFLQMSISIHIFQSLFLH